MNSLRRTQLLGQLSQAVSAFYTATQELLADQQVTTFTASEFGRTLTPNGNGGTDHAWGNHHFIIGERREGRNDVRDLSIARAGRPERYEHSRHTDSYNRGGSICGDHGSMVRRKPWSEHGAGIPESGQLRYLQSGLFGIVWRDSIP